MAETILLIAQVSSVLTTLAAIVATALMFKAHKHMVDGEFKSTIFASAIFLLIATLGSAAMAGFHVSQSFTELEILEEVWYVFMFSALVFSLYESVALVTFGKKILSLENSIVRRKNHSK
ncbi:MAG TPA: hypothetical protein VKE88_02765 [Candidatus Nanoarchaeia archaeon]|nr:hypothetical protein [Candidatus Nanoarchaeia archaeon]